MFMKEQLVSLYTAVVTGENSGNSSDPIIDELWRNKGLI